MPQEFSVQFLLLFSALSIAESSYAGCKKLSECFCSGCALAGGDSHLCVDDGKQLQCWGEGGRESMDFLPDILPEGASPDSPIKRSRLWAGGDSHCFASGGQTLCWNWQDRKVYPYPDLGPAVTNLTISKNYVCGKVSDGTFNCAAIRSSSHTDDSTSIFLPEKFDGTKPGWEISRLVALDHAICAFHPTSKRYYRDDFGYHRDNNKAWIEEHLDALHRLPLQQFHIDCYLPETELSTTPLQIDNRDINGTKIHGDPWIIEDTAIIKWKDTICFQAERGHSADLLCFAINEKTAKVTEVLAFGDSIPDGRNAPHVVARHIAVNSSGTIVAFNYKNYQSQADFRWFPLHHVPIMGSVTGNIKGTHPDRPWEPLEGKPVQKGGPDGKPGSDGIDMTPFKDSFCFWSDTRLECVKQNEFLTAWSSRDTRFRSWMEAIDQLLDQNPLPYNLFSHLTLRKQLVKASKGVYTDGTYHSFLTNAIKALDLIGPTSFDGSYQLTKIHRARLFVLKLVDEVLSGTQSPFIRDAFLPKLQQGIKGALVSEKIAKLSDFPDEETKRKAADAIFEKIPVNLGDEDSIQDAIRQLRAKKKS